ncbi:hypothetical protein ACVW1C_005717 [Bradyrhizobium sp. USDA 4011]
MAAESKPSAPQRGSGPPNGQVHLTASGHTAVTGVAAIGVAAPISASLALNSTGATFLPDGFAESHQAPDLFHPPEIRLTEPVPAEASITEAVQVGMTTDAEVIWAPFSENGIAERLAQNPDFYRQLIQLAAVALRKDAENYSTHGGQGNSAAVIKAELNEIANRFESAALELDGFATDRFASAARAIVEARDQIVRFTESYPTFTKVFLELTGVIFGGYALHQLGGTSGDVAAFVSYAVIRREKLSEIIGAWRGKKDDEE